MEMPLEEKGKKYKILLQEACGGGGPRKKKMVGQSSQEGVSTEHIIGEAEETEPHPDNSNRKESFSLKE